MFTINLITLTVNRQLQEYGEIKELIRQAFPKNEQIPMPLLKLLALRKNVQFLAHYDNGVFCGISYTVCSDKMAFVLYLAVNERIRSKGYGTAIIQRLKELYKDKPISLNIEVIAINADNYKQRVKRQEFYKKNGFHDTGYKIVDNGEMYSILSTGNNFCVDDYRSVIKQFSFGFYVPKVSQ